MNSISPKEENRKYGRYSDIEKGKYKVVDFIPEDGTSIRFKDLETKCKDHKISHRILLKDLERLQDAGMVVKDAVKIKRGAGTQYRRIIAPFTPPPNYSIFQKAMEEVEAIQDKNEREKKAMRAIHGLYITIYITILSELIEYTLNPDDQKAKKRLDSALNDFIVPMVKQTMDLVPHPATYDKQEISALVNAIKLGFEDWDKVWDSSASH